MPLINVHDLAQLLDRQGYYIDDEDGEVVLNYDPDESNVDNLLIVLAAIGALEVKPRPDDHQLCFYLPHWKCYNNLEAYCQDFPNYPACKSYDL